MKWKADDVLRHIFMISCMAVLRNYLLWLRPAVIPVVILSFLKSSFNINNCGELIILGSVY
ncbi:MAG: hypothetical protein ABI687_10490 [Flavitalea sp.]